MNVLLHNSSLTPYRLWAIEKANFAHWATRLNAVTFFAREPSKVTPK